MKLSDLKENPNNPRTITAAALEKLANRIKSFPKMMELREIIVDADNVVLGGNMRLRAMHKLGLKEIPDSWVKSASDLTPEEQHEFIITDNTPAGSWEYELLNQQWELEDLKAWGVEVQTPEVEKVDIENAVDQDETRTFNTEIMVIRNAIAEGIRTKKKVLLSEAYLMAETLIYEILKGNEYYTG